VLALRRPRRDAAAARREPGLRLHGGGGLRSSRTPFVFLVVRECARARCEIRCPSQFCLFVRADRMSRRSSGGGCGWGWAGAEEGRGESWRFYISGAGSREAGPGCAGRSLVAAAQLRASWRKWLVAVTGGVHAELGTRRGPCSVSRFL
jgi:hypothetical protein